MKKAKQPFKHPSGEPADTPTAGGQEAKATKDAIQGEGNYAAAREFNESERKFVESGKVDAAARAAAPKTAAEQREMLAAEQEGKRRAKEDYPPPPEAKPKHAPASPREPAKDAPRGPADSTKLKGLK